VARLARIYPGAGRQRRALAAFYLAMEWGAAPGAHAAFMAAAGLVLIAALLHESHRLAFRDQLTGLPGRRALEERLRSLGANYVIAMATSTISSPSTTSTAMTSATRC